MHYKATMKKHNFDKNSHIQGYYIPKNICDDLISFFKKHKHRHHIGQTGMGVKKETKDSTDITISYNDSDVLLRILKTLIFNITNLVVVLRNGILKDT